MAANSVVPGRTAGLRILACVNLVILLAVTFYIFHLLVTEYLEKAQEPSFCWFSGVISATLFFILVTLQATIDFFLFAVNTDELGLVQTCTIWQKMSTIFLSFIIIGLLFSLLCDQLIVNPTLTLILVLGEILGRLLTMIFVQKFIAAAMEGLGLREPVSESTADGSGLEPYIKYISADFVENGGGLTATTKEKCPPRVSEV